MASTGDGKKAKEIPAPFARDCFFSDNNQPHEKRHYKAEDEALGETKAHERRHCLAEDHARDEPKHHEKRHFVTADHKFGESQ